MIPPLLLFLVLLFSIFNLIEVVRPFSLDTTTNTALPVCDQIQACTECLSRGDCGYCATKHEHTHKHAEEPSCAPLRNNSLRCVGSRQQSMQCHLELDVLRKVESDAEQLNYEIIKSPANLLRKGNPGHLSVINIDFRRSNIVKQYENQAVAEVDIAVDHALPLWPGESRKITVSTEFGVLKSGSNGLTVASVLHEHTSSDGSDAIGGASDIDELRDAIVRRLNCSRPCIVSHKNCSEVCSEAWKRLSQIAEQQRRDPYFLEQLLRESIEVRLPDRVVGMLGHVGLGAFGFDEEARLLYQTAFDGAGKQHVVRDIIVRRHDNDNHGTGYQFYAVSRPLRSVRLEWIKGDGFQLERLAFVVRRTDYVAPPPPPPTNEKDVSGDENEGDDAGDMLTSDDEGDASMPAYEAPALGSQAQSSVSGSSDASKVHVVRQSLANPPSDSYSLRLQLEQWISGVSKPSRAMMRKTAMRAAQLESKARSARRAGGALVVSGGATSSVLLGACAGLLIVAFGAACWHCLCGDAVVKRSRVMRPTDPDSDFGRFEEVASTRYGSSIYGAGLRPRTVKI